MSPPGQREGNTLAYKACRAEQCCCWPSCQLCADRGAKWPWKSGSLLCPWDMGHSPASCSVGKAPCLTRAGGETAKVNSAESLSCRHKALPEEIKLRLKPLKESEVHCCQQPITHLLLPHRSWWGSGNHRHAVSRSHFQIATSVKGAWRTSASSQKESRRNEHRRATLAASQ